jgi:hypothetical protein
VALVLAGWKSTMDETAARLEAKEALSWLRREVGYTTTELYDLVDDMIAEDKLLEQTLEEARDGRSS